MVVLGNFFGWKKILICEGLGKWGFFMGIVYLIWCMIGVFFFLGIFFFLGGLIFCIDIYFVCFNKLGCIGYDKLGNIFVIDVCFG